MDFIGMRISEQEELANILTIYYNQALVYDQRFRECTSVEIDRAIEIGLIPEQGYFQRGNLEFSYDVVSPSLVYSDHMKLACSVYLDMEPQNIAFDSGSGLCMQRRESFRHWLAVKTSLLRFGPKYFTYRIKHLSKLRSKLNEHHHHTNPSVKKLFKIFVSLPKEVIFDSKLAVQFGLPIVAETTINRKITEEWLVLMSWWHVIISELHPTLCQLQSMRGTKREKSENIKHQSLIHLRVIFDQCSALKSSFPEELNNFLTPEYENLLQEKSDLPSLKISKEQKKIFLKEVMQFTTRMTRVVIIYMVNVVSQNPKECLTYLEAKTESYIKRVHSDVKVFLRYRHFYGLFEVHECKHYVLRHIESLLKKYSKKKFNITSIFGGISEVHQRTIYRLQKFIRSVMDAISTSFIEVFCKYYSIKMKKEYAKRVMKSLSLHITWTSMNLILNVPRFPTSLDEDQKILVLAAYPLQITDAEKLVTPSVIYNCVIKTCEAIQYCNRNIFAIRHQVMNRIQLPVSYIYGDFPYFLVAFSENFNTCDHPVMDLHELTEGRIRTFMTQMLVCLHNNMPAIDQVLKHAKEYLRFREHLIE